MLIGYSQSDQGPEPISGGALRTKIQRPDACSGASVESSSNLLVLPDRACVELSIKSHGEQVMLEI
jgi:hypothetical protein